MPSSVLHEHITHVHMIKNEIFIWKDNSLSTFLWNIKVLKYIFITHWKSKLVKVEW